MTILAQILQSQAQKEVTANANFSAVSPAGLFAQKPSTTSGTTFGYYGGVISVNGVLTTISDGTVSLTDNTTNYVERAYDGTVSANTTGFSADQIPLFIIVTSSGSISSISDKRIAYDERNIGYLSIDVSGSADVTLTAAQSRNQIIDLTGTLTGSINVIAPAIPTFWFLYNNTSGAFTLTWKTSGGTGVTITQGDRVLLYGDGTDIYALS